MGLIYCAQYRKEATPYIYIGKTKKTLKWRKDKHIEQAVLLKDEFHKTLLKKGTDNWDWDVLDECDNEFLNEREKFWIEKHKNEGIILTNTVHNRKKTKSTSNQNPLSKRSSAQKAWLSKDYLNWQIKSGRLRPVKDLTTNDVFQSLNRASEFSNISRTSIKNSCDTGYLAKNNHKYIYCDLEGNELPASNYDEKKKEKKVRRSFSKIKNLNTGKTFDTLEQVSKTFSIKKHLIQSVCNGTYISTSRKLENNKKIYYSFCYVDNEGEDVIKQNHKKFLKKLDEQRKFCLALFDISDKEYKKPLLFNDFQEIINDPNIAIESSLHFNEVIEGKRSHINGYRIAKYDRFAAKPLLTATHKLDPKRVLKKVTCLDTGEIYQSMAEASRKLELNRQQISECCNGKIYKTGKDKYKNGLRFCFLDNFSKPILLKKHKQFIDSFTNIGVPLFCARLGGVFPSKKEFLLKASEQKVFIPSKRLDKHLEDPQKYDLDGIFVYKLDKNIFQ